MPTTIDKTPVSPSPEKLPIQTDHNQPISDPISHFESIPWCYRLLNASPIMGIMIPDRTSLPNDEGCLMRETLNNPSCIKASINFFTFTPHTKSQAEEMGEDPENPFIENIGLVDLGSGVNGFAKTVHGGFFGVLLDEIMGNMANLQAKNGAYTAYLKVSYKKPVYTPQVVCLRGRVVRRVGKKLFLKGSMENSEGQILAEAEGLWIIMGKDIGQSIKTVSAKL